MKKENIFDRHHLILYLLAIILLVISMILVSQGAEIFKANTFDDHKTKIEKQEKTDWRGKLIVF